MSATTAAFANDGVKLDAEQRVIDLPPNQWYLTLFGDANDPKFQLLKHWVETHPGLTNLKSQVNFNIYQVGDVRFERYKSTLPGLPCIRLQNSEGIVASEFWSDYWPIAIHYQIGISKTGSRHAPDTASHRPGRSLPLLG